MIISSNAHSIWWCHEIVISSKMLRKRFYLNFLLCERNYVVLRFVHFFLLLLLVVVVVAVIVDFFFLSLQFVFHLISMGIGTTNAPLCVVIFRSNRNPLRNWSTRQLTNRKMCAVCVCGCVFDCFDGRARNHFLQVFNSQINCFFLLVSLNLPEST